MPEPRITYRDYMLWKTANAMADRLRTTLDQIGGTHGRTQAGRGREA